ncbi:MarR family winged helix-turn-helix transcriptional regulator [Bdellovibrio sp. HCB290]|uniref:MarR family winged helix-turn-helix transcriptional regulator n=1 Tax=Bdellovibrio sp. HCB290 TaxID=3394356 RepID=UPI0039B58FD4
MAKLFIQTLPTQEELQQNAAELCPNVDPSALYTHLLFRKISTDLESKFDNFFAKWNLSPGRYTLLIMLRKAPQGLMPSEIAQKVGVTQATISGLINSLEKAELVKRTTHEKDGRSFVIQLTEKGLALLEEVSPIWFSNIGNFFGQFNDDDRKQLNDLLARMSQNVHLLNMK